MVFILVKPLLRNMWNGQQGWREKGIRKTCEKDLERGGKQSKISFIVWTVGD